MIETTTTNDRKPEPPDLTLEEKTILEKSGGDHLGHAQCVQFMNPDKFVFNDEFGWLRYNGTHWTRSNAQGRLEQAITNCLSFRQQLGVMLQNETLIKKSFQTAANMTGTLKLFRTLPGAYEDVEVFDADPDLINCKNGVVNLRTGEILPHNPRLYFTYCLPVEYDPDADPFEWVDFLSSAVDDDEVLEFLQAAIGYTLTGHTTDEILFYIYGPPRSGKGTFTETLLALLRRPLAAEVNFETFTDRRDGDTNNFDLAPLKPCRFVAASESSRYASLNAAKVKQVTGGNYVYCSFKHKTHFSYRPQYKIWLSSNYKTNVDVDDNAAWGRLRVIEFPTSHLGTEDKTLKTRLRSPDALTGLLKWAVDGAKRWYDDDDALKPPAAVVRAGKEARDDLDIIGQWIVERCTLEDAQAFTTIAVLHQDYSNFCDENGYKSKGGRQFGKTLELKGYANESRRLGGKVRRGRVGIAIEVGEIDL